MSREYRAGLSTVENSYPNFSRDSFLKRVDNRPNAISSTSFHSRLCRVRTGSVGSAVRGRLQRPGIGNALRQIREVDFGTGPAT
jgi:hypothetical protein